MAVLHRLGGVGPNLALIHGFGSDRFTWIANTPALAGAATVWAVDLPGHGEAKNMVGDGRPETLAHAVANELGQLNGTATIVGHSLGGTVALHLAALVPEKIACLVLIAPAGIGARTDPRFLEAFPNVESEQDARLLLEGLVERKRLVAPAMVDHVLTGLANPDRRKALGTIAAAMRDISAPPLPRNIPVTVIWGENDRINRPPASADIDRVNRFVSLADTGHLPQVESIARTNRAILEAISQVADSS